MKKLITLACLFLAIALNASAEGYGVLMEICMKNSPYYGKVNRAPRRMSLEVVFDPETKCVTITGDETLEVEVILYNASGQIEDCSSSLNSCLFMTTDGRHELQIEAEDWSAEGVIEI